MNLAPGTRIASYEIVSQLGAGGMGAVYRAHDTKLDRDVAIKVLLPSVAADPDRLARFQREARTLASLNHPHIGAIHGLVEEHGVTALVLELVDGSTLADRIARGAIPLDEALFIARQIADALETAHDQGIIHRDLKPANIKVKADGIVKVLDFGLAKAIEKSTGVDGTYDERTHSPTIISPAMTRAGVILGTAAYMSPEQAKGRAVDKRADIWAFGCVLYEMLTGRRAFDSEDVTDTMVSILTKEPDWRALPVSTPAPMRRLLLRCLQKDVQRRLRDIGDVRIELDDAITNPESDTAGPTRRSFWRFAAPTAVVAIIAFAAGGLWRGAFQTVSPSVPVTGARFRHVTWDDSFSTEPAISPDGTLVVYASDREGGGQLDLWLQRASGGQPVRLTSDPADDRAPAFSPDGSLIAFQSTRNGGGIYVMPALGGDARLIAPEGRRPHFSPDGKNIAYWTGPWLGGPRTPRSAVFVVPSNGGQPVNISKNFAAAVSPVWSPDGRHILLFGNQSGNPAEPEFDWWLVSVETSSATPTGAYALLQAKDLRGSRMNNSAVPTPDALPTSWTADGVAFSAQFEHSVNLWRLKIDESSGKAVERSLERLTVGTGSDESASVDSRGSIVYEVQNSSRDSMLLPIDANAGKPLGPVRRLTADLELTDGRNSLDQAGRVLAYAKIRPNESEIWLKDVQSGRERHLVTTPASQLNPMISFDGTKVAYTVPESGTIVGYVIPTTGGTTKKLCDRCNLQGWLSDSNRIVVVNAGAGAYNPGSVPGRVRVVSVSDGKEQDVLTDPKSGIGRVDISPDDRWMAFQSRGRVWLMPFDLRTPPDESRWTPVLTPAPGSVERACGWSPNGQLLYMLLERDGFRDLWAQRIDTTHGTPNGEPFVVQHLHEPRREWGSTPYGTAIVNGAFVFNQTELTGSIWLRDPGRTP